ncbi:MAG: helix-turn-helix transcriptional regulator [Atopobiaceae bacterium]|nr:helix-turn-helix transcriptional regulator [Atopobiaceae bacterium]
MSEIRRLREGCGWSMSRLAREAGVSHAAVSHWERGGVANMRLGCAIRVAEALGVSVYDLVEGERGRRR